MFQKIVCIVLKLGFDGFKSSRISYPEETLVVGSERVKQRCLRELPLEKKGGEEGERRICGRPDIDLLRSIVVATHPFLTSSCVE